MSARIGLLRGIELDNEEPAASVYDEARDIQVCLSDPSMPLVRSGAVVARTETLTKTIRDVPDQD